jgi:hypothetical protein
MSKNEPKRGILQISDDYEEIYCTGVIGGASEADIRIILLKNKVSTDDKGKLINQDVSNHQLIMSPIIAARLYNELKKQIDNFDSIQKEMLDNSQDIKKPE